jgi:hypothetical protein
MLNDLKRGQHFHSVVSDILEPACIVDTAPKIATDCLGSVDSLSRDVHRQNSLDFEVSSSVQSKKKATVPTTNVQENVPTE